MRSADCKICYLRLFAMRRFYLWLFIVLFFLAPICWELSAYYGTVGKEIPRRIFEYVGAVGFFTGLLSLFSWYKLKNNQFN